jgi:chromatin remodeling complex protein RSC6
MVRTSKKSVPVNEVSALSTVSVDPAPPAPPASEPVKKAKKTKKELPPSTVVEEPVVLKESSDVVSDPPAVSEDVVENVTETKLVELGSTILELNNLVVSIKAQFKSLERIVNREMKAAKKITARKVKRVGNRQPSGFVRPTLISNELADFLNVEHGSMMARTTVSGMINAYIRANSLQDKDNGRIIVPDEKLKGLLCDVDMTENLSYFNLQKYMKRHFIKPDVPSADVVTNE